MSADDVREGEDGEDTRMEDVAPQTEDGEDDEDDGDSDDSEPEAVLAVTRTRRANAGNRMHKLLELAEQEDAQQEEEYGAIFAEAADDVEFEAADGEEDDVNMDSSSSEDEDAEAGPDEDAGERELKKQERSENKKKRKRESLLQDAMKRAAARVGPKVAPARSALAAASPSASASSSTFETRPRKKSERVSWLPEAPEGAIRASSRHLAVQNKTAVHERLKEKEKHRLRTVAIMKAAERRKEANTPKTLTQEERLEEAARTERMNTKSLNRWEVAERKRQEEQKARLAALKNHRLEGPIISYYSGPALWVNDKLKVVGKEALEPEGKGKKLVTEVQEDEDEEVDDETPAPAVQPASSASPKVEGRERSISLPIRRSVTPSASAAAHTQPLLHAPSPKEEDPSLNFLQGIEEYANGHAESSQPSRSPSTQPQTPSSAITAHPAHSTQSPSQQHPHIVPYETPNSQPHGAFPPLPMPPQEHTGELILAQFQTTFHAAPQTPLQPQQQPLAQPPPPLQPKLPPRRELATRILITLTDFPQENMVTSKKEQPDFIRHHLLDWPLQPIPTTKKAEKALLQPPPPSKKAICAVTGQPARYCDPATGLYYVDATALKSMRWVINSKGRWSPLTGTFAHTTDKQAQGRPAKGVPDLFLMTGEELAKRQVEVRKRREEQERVRAEAREKARKEAEAQAEKLAKERAEAQARAQAQAQARAPGSVIVPHNMHGGTQHVYRSEGYPQVSIPAQQRPSVQMHTPTQSSGQYAPPHPPAQQPGQTPSYAQPRAPTIPAPVQASAPSPTPAPAPAKESYAK
jgi:vacuolar protein sorting-associated protein 72